jgi:cytochrome P450
MGDLFAAYGPVANLAAGAPLRFFSPRPRSAGVVFVRGPELLHQVSINHGTYHHYQLIGPLAPQAEPTARQRPLRYFGAGLFDQNGDEHRRSRRLMLPAFHRKRVEAYRDQMVAQTEAMLAGWRAGERRDIHSDLVQLTMGIATSTLFGVDPARTGARVGLAIQHSLEISFRPATLLLRLDVPGLPYRRLLDLTAQIEGEMRRIIAERRASGSDDGDVLSMLIHAHDEDDGSLLSEDDLVSHAELLFMAGHETSSSALAWTLFLLSQHPQVMADLYDELHAALDGAAPTVEQLGRLPLLDRVVKESMRVLPPVPWNARVAAEATEIGGYHVPAETEVIMSIYHTQHMPEIYAHPERFDPARWESQDYAIFEYVPFNGGPRMCIGASFAMMEIKIILAMLLQRFRLELTEGARIDRLVTATMGPRHGLPMIVQPTDGRYERGAGGARGNVREMVALP